MTSRTRTGTSRPPLLADLIAVIAAGGFFSRRIGLPFEFRTLTAGPGLDCPIPGPGIPHPSGKVSVTDTHDGCWCLSTNDRGAVAPLGDLEGDVG